MLTHHTAAPSAPCRSHLGVTYVETSITLIIFLGVVFFFIDAARYFYILGVLNHAVHSGLDLASKLEMEVGTSASDCPPSMACQQGLTPPNPCMQYMKRWNHVRETVERLANLVTTNSSEQSSARRYQFKHYYADPQNTTCLKPVGEDGLYADVAIIRPGEKALRMDDDEEDIEYEVPGRPFAAGWPRVPDSWVRVLHDNPIGIRIDVEFRPLTPFLPAMTMHVEQYGRRLSKAIGASLPLLPTIPPAPTATPTRTPEGGPILPPGDDDPTEDPDGPEPPAVPPTPTPAPTFDCSCCHSMSAGCDIQGCLRCWRAR